MPMRLEWDPRKERLNRQKHGVAFDEASTVFADSLSITISDPDHSDDEERWVTIGLSHRQRLLVVVHTEEDEPPRFESSARVRATPVSGGNMKKAVRENGEMRGHYDFRGGVRGKYATRYAEGTNVVVLDPDVAEMFPGRDLVNETLRAVGRVVQMRERRKVPPKTVAATSRIRKTVRTKSRA